VDNEQLSIVAQILQILFHFGARLGREFPIEIAKHNFATLIEVDFGGEVDRAGEAAVFEIALLDGHEFGNEVGFAAPPGPRSAHVDNQRVLLEGKDVHGQLTRNEEFLVGLDEDGDGDALGVEQGADDAFLPGVLDEQDHKVPEGQTVHQAKQRCLLALCLVDKFYLIEVLLEVAPAREDVEYYMNLILNELVQTFGMEEAVSD
jgi:hypothetical protein